MNTVLRPIVLVYSTVAGFFRFLGDMTYLIGDAIAGMPRSLFDKQGRRLGWANLWEQMDRVGVKSIPIVCLVLFCIGAILSLQIAPILKGYGALNMVADIIAVTVGRELGPLVSAVVLTGFAGASIAAELGTMVVSEEIEALEASAIDPIRFLVAPRVLATTIMMICIAIVGDFAGCIGGLATSNCFLGISSSMYLHHTFDALKLKDFLTGLIKAGVFGMLISGLACKLGLSVTGGAQGVGVATTKTVVLTIVALISVDLIFTSVFYFIGF
ncbi:MAG: ABC transporter permease [Tepidisphaeraceae bacterium]|jgi:phospholipid/cholesterol/gamma-HCH transport system permease protein